MCWSPTQSVSYAIFTGTTLSTLNYHNTLTENAVDLAHILGCKFFAGIAGFTKFTNLSYLGEFQRFPVIAANFTLHYKIF